MRFSAVVSALVVSASFALGGCAADAEPTTGTDQPNVALSGTQNNPDQMLNNVDQAGNRYADNFANPSAEARARTVLTYTGGESNPRIDVQPSPFGVVNMQKVGVEPSVFNPKSALENGIGLESGYTPYSHVPKP
jgi:predicted lipoprotein